MLKKVKAAVVALASHWDVGSLVHPNALGRGKQQEKAPKAYLNLECIVES